MLVVKITYDTLTTLGCQIGNIEQRALKLSDGLFFTHSTVSVS